MANENLKVKLAVDYVRDNYQHQADAANYGFDDYWMDGRGVMYYGSGDSEDLCFLLHSLLLEGGIASDRIRTYHGYYQSPTILYGLHTWVGYKRPSDDVWVVIDPVYGAVFTDIDTLPEMLYTDYYITGFAWQNENVYVPIDVWELHFLDSAAFLTLPAITIDATAAPSFAITVDFPSVTALGYGGGIANVIFSVMDSTGVGIQGKVGSLIRDLPMLLVEATGLTGILGTMSEETEAFEISASGYVDTDGDVDAIMASIEAYATGNAEDRFAILRHSRW